MLSITLLKFVRLRHWAIRHVAGIREMLLKKNHYKAPALDFEISRNTTFGCIIWASMLQHSTTSHMIIQGRNNNGDGEKKPSTQGGKVNHV